MPQLESTPVYNDAIRQKSLNGGGFVVGSARRKGSYHEKNEDSVTIFPGSKPKFCAAADGVGGGSHGEVASAALLEYLKAPPVFVLLRYSLFLDWLQRADKFVSDAVAQESDKPGATTGVAAWFLWGGYIRVINVGDCRAYVFHAANGKKQRIPNQKFEQITIDQTYKNLGLFPPHGGSEDDPARMVGVGSIGSPNTYRINLSVGSVLLLCTDGLHKFVPDKDLRYVISIGLRNNKKPQEICETLVKLAIDNGGHDDASAVIAIRRAWLTRREELLLFGFFIMAAITFIFLSFDLISLISKMN